MILRSLGITSSERHAPFAVVDVVDGLAMVVALFPCDSISNNIREDRFGVLSIWVFILEIVAGFIIGILVRVAVFLEDSVLVGRHGCAMDAGDKFGIPSFFFGHACNAPRARDGTGWQADGMFIGMLGGGAEIYATIPAPVKFRS